MITILKNTVCTWFSEQLECFPFPIQFAPEIILCLQSVLLVLKNRIGCLRIQARASRSLKSPRSKQGCVKNTKGIETIATKSYCLAIALAQRPHVVIATPGQLADHIKTSGQETICGLNWVRMIMLNEADQLLTSGSERGWQQSMIDPYWQCVIKVFLPISQM